MSQVMTELEDTESRRVAVPDEFENFEYRPVPPLAPISLFLGVCAIAGLLVVPGLAIGVVGLIAGALCLRQIRRSEGDLGGLSIARLGTWLSLLFLVSGSLWHSYVYATEVPEGHQRVSFNWLSVQPIGIDEEGAVKVSEGVEAIDGKPIFIKGYMYPTRQKTGIKEFVMVKDTGQCCFGGNPKVTDMVIVRFKDGTTIDHKEQILVSVAGVFHAKAVGQSGELTAIYSLDGTYFK